MSLLPECCRPRLSSRRGSRASQSKVIPHSQPVSWELSGCCRSGSRHALLACHRASFTAGLVRSNCGAASTRRMNPEAPPGAGTGMTHPPSITMAQATAIHAARVRHMTGYRVIRVSPLLDESDGYGLRVLRPPQRAAAIIHDSAAAAGRTRAGHHSLRPAAMLGSAPMPGEPDPR